MIGNQLSDYRDWIDQLKSKIKSARSKVALSVNSQLIELYWDLGKELSEKSKISAWGTGIIEKISIELNHEFPEMQGFSRRNLYAIKQWFEFYHEEFEFVPQSVAQIPWGHNRLIINRVKSVSEALFYTVETVKQGWSRDMLDIQLDGRLFERKAPPTHNFKVTLPDQQSKIAVENLKDPYNFDFLGLLDDAQEREIEKELVHNITEFLLESGKGFAFIGRQFKIEISDSDYFIDLLFYHLELRCYVVIELKAGKFKPEFAGKLNFYLSAVDSQIKKQVDNPSIGILLCKKKDKIEAEYSLRDIKKPIGISEYILTQSIPENIKTQLPSIEELEIDLNNKIMKYKR